MPYGSLLTACRGGHVLTPAEAPATVYGLHRWYEARRATYQTVGGVVAAADGDPVGEVLNLAPGSSGGTANLRQATAGSRPTLKTAGDGLDGQPILQCDGVDDYLGAAVDQGAAKTRFLVYRKRTAAAASAKVACYFAAGNARLLTNTATGAGLLYAQNEAAGTVSLGGDVTAWQILVLRHTTTSLVEVWSAGVLLGSFDPADAYSTGASITFGATNTGTTPSDIDLAAFLSYSVALTNARINLLAAYLRSWLPSLAWADI